MKTSLIIACGFIALLATGNPLSAQITDTEAELLELEAELDREQEMLNERRAHLEQRKFEMQLLKRRMSLSGEPETPEDAAFKVELLRAHAHAQQKRITSIAELEKLAEILETLQRGDGRVGRPRAVGPRARAIEEENLTARKEVETRNQQLIEEILTSMQTALNQNGSLNDAEYQWIQTQATPSKDTRVGLDEATLEWAKTIFKMEHRRRNPPPENENKNFEYP